MPSPRAWPSLTDLSTDCGRPVLRLFLLLTAAGLLTCDWITELGNDPPGAVGTIPDQIVEVDSAVVLDLADYFADPDGDTLTYTVLLQPVDKTLTAFERRCIRAGPLSRPDHAVNSSFQDVMVTILFTRSRLASALLLGRIAPLFPFRRALPARRLPALGAHAGLSTDC